MMTKREFAEEIVRDFCEKYDIKREEAHAHIYSSSRLAVALEFLGELSGIELNYSTERGGTEYRHIVFDENGKFKDLHVITTRDMLRMLPDTL